LNGVCRLASRSALVLVASFAVGLLLTAGSAFAASASGRAVFPRLALGAARSSADGCGKNGVVCSVVNAPLDRTGGVAGTVALHVEVLPARGTQRGVIFLVAGGPGQGSAQTFDLARPLSAFLFRFLFPGYTLVAYDDRGTGRSGHLDCPSLASATSDQSMTSVVADCAAQLGPERAFYSTADHAADLESVRQALGFGQIAIYGVSYGTKLAVAYAAAYPQNVSRLLLDSVLPPDDSDPFASRILQSMPTTLAGYCPSDWCAGATPDFGADVVAVANQLAASPLQARVREPNGRTTPVTLPALAFLSMVTDADLNPGLAAELPAAVHAARDGDPQPLLHAYQLESVSRGQSNDFSDTLFLATVCDDGPLPWQSDTPVEDRPASMQAALGALPAGSFGPFGSWAAAFGNVAMCTGWPDAGGAVRPLAGPLPDVPVLAISGGLDLRTPTAGAASVIARFPHGHLLLVPGVGHSVLTADASGCSQNAVRQWVLKTRHRRIAREFCRSSVRSPRFR
jgi:pimeloyl-ACP methyl ester carboxylesterase